MQKKSLHKNLHLKQEKILKNTDHVNFFVQMFTGD